MPIPFLIGGLIAAAATAVVAAALSDNDEPSNSNDSNEEERRRREAAEKERKERERANKQKTEKEVFQKQGRIFGQNLAQALPSSLVRARSRGEFELDFDLNNGPLRFDMEDASRRDYNLLVTVDGLESILTQKTSHKEIIENLVTFSELYKPEFQSGSELREKEVRINHLDRAIDKLQIIKCQLIKKQQENQSSKA